MTLEKRKHYDTSSAGTKLFLIVRVFERTVGNFSYQAFKATDEDFQFTVPKTGRKVYDTAEKAFKAGGIGSSIESYVYVPKKKDER